MKTTTTKDKASTALMPKLRFPEFHGAEAWKEKPLKAAAEINPANGGLPDSFVYIDLESVDAGELKAKERISRVGAPSRAQRLVEHGDIIYQIVRPYQRNNLLCEFADDANYVASTGYAQLRAKGSNRFLYQSIHTDSFVGRVIAKCTGSNYPAINSSDLAEIHLPIPPTLPEQQKIAECLSSLDELMAAQARKVDALKNHKKGLMQQLFPREGETQPRVRFPEFMNEREWEAKPLGSFCKIGDIDHKMPPSVANGIPYVMTGDFIGINGIDFECAKKISTQDYEQLSRKIKPEFGDIVIARYASVGAVRYIETDIKFLVSYSCATIKCSRSENSQFLYYFLQSDALQSKIGLEVNMSSQKNIGIDSIKKLTILLPDLPEQQKVAGSLANVDALIAAETEKLEALKTHKNGLMQQLFPAPEEVAG